MTERKAPPLWRLGILVLLAAIALYITACIALYGLQGSLLYKPQDRSIDAPSHTLRLHNGGESLVITTLERPGKQALIYFGGNGEDVSRNLPAFAEHFPQHALYLLHYRGYGGSSGSPSEQGNFSDAQALYNYVSTRYPHIALMGRSLGTGIATYLASRNATERLLLVTPYDSIEELAGEQYPYFPVSLLLRDPYRSWLYAPRVDAPTTILMAGKDQVIPNASTLKSFGRFNDGLARLITLGDAGHNSISADPRYFPLLRQGLD